MEKKAQAECERHLQEQAKKIEKLSSIVLYSNREDNRQNFEKVLYKWHSGILQIL